MSGRGGTLEDVFKKSSVTLFIYLFIFDGTGSLLLHKLFSGCGEQGLLFIARHDLLAVVASLAAEHRLSGMCP